MTRFSQVKDEIVRVIFRTLKSPSMIRHIRSTCYSRILTQYIQQLEKKKMDDPDSSKPCQKTEYTLRESVSWSCYRVQYSLHHHHRLSAAINGPFIDLNYIQYLKDFQNK